jgi:hypothetical protein
VQPESSRKGIPATLYRYFADRDRVAFDACIAALVPLLVAIGQNTIPSHWSSTCFDSEFSGWVAPVANRLATGQELYADGAHSPMAPLPYVLMYVLTLGDALWIHESVANFTCQSLAVVTLLAGFHRVLPWPAPLVAAFGLTLSFLSLPKVILYDSLAQLFAALSAVLAMRALLLSTEEARRARLLLAGVASAFGFLAKQSTGTGVVLGILLALWLPRDLGDARRRAVLTLAFLGSAGGTLVALLALLSPWIDVSGFVHDVLLTSTEAKGGRDVLLHNLGRFASQVWTGVVSLGVPPLALGIAAMAYAALRSSRSSEPPSDSHWPVLPTVVGAMIGSALSTVFAARLKLEYLDIALHSVLYIAIAAMVVARFRSEKPPDWLRALGLFTLVTLPAAVTHSLSVDTFRWSYDNNPLIWVPVAFTATLLVRAAGSPKGVRAAVAAGLATFAALALTSGSFSRLWNGARECTVNWREVAFLRGAKLRPKANGMRQLVTHVRKLAPAKTDSVLLYPNDPNVEAWFERARPNLSSAIVFGDQYWDRYVDGDFARLEQQPPRVIVVGPRKVWRFYSHAPQPDRATERLGVLIVERLIPARYRHAEAVAIDIGASGDFMDVYVLAENGR